MCIILSDNSNIFTKISAQSHKLILLNNLIPLILTI